MRHSIYSIKPSFLRLNSGFKEWESVNTVVIATYPMSHYPWRYETTVRTLNHVGKILCQTVIKFSIRKWERQGIVNVTIQFWVLYEEEYRWSYVYVLTSVVVTSYRFFTLLSSWVTPSSFTHLSVNHYNTIMDRTFSLL